MYIARALIGLLAAGRHISNRVPKLKWFKANFRLKPIIKIPASPRVNPERMDLL